MVIHLANSIRILGLGLPANMFVIPGRGFVRSGCYQSFVFCLLFYHQPLARYFIYLVQVQNNTTSALSNALKGLAKPRPRYVGVYAQ